MFQFPPFASFSLFYSRKDTSFRYLVVQIHKQAYILEIQGIRSGFPHSEIIGSKVVRTSPTHIAAYHVLHRLLLPRHPLNALKTLDHSHYRYLLRFASKENEFS